jgi:type I restriction enzyme M protein
MNTQELKKLENDLWDAANQLRQGAGLKATEYASPILGLIFLKFADIKYRQFEGAIKQEFISKQGSRIEQSEKEIAIAQCGFYLPEHARYSYLRDLPESDRHAEKVKEAMQAIEDGLDREDFKNVLPQDEYFKITQSDKSLPKTLLKTFDDIPDDATGDILGKIYEYFLGKFALSEGQGGGEFFTPTSVVKYMVEVIEPYHGKLFDPACGSAGMFVQSAQFIQRHKAHYGDQSKAIFVTGQDKTGETVKLAKMNLLINGLKGEIKEANTFTNDLDCVGQFDYVMANPPFNVKDVKLDIVKNKPHFNEYGIPQNKTKSTGTKKEDKDTIPNANYLWINLFATSLNETGRAALVMPNSASDARHSEQEIRIRLLENGLISQMTSLPSNLFYTVTLPAALWFFDKAKAAKQDTRVLFVDARNVFRQIDRAHRELTDEQVQNLGIISRLQQGQSERYLELIDDYLQQTQLTLPLINHNYQALCLALKDYAGKFNDWVQQQDWQEEHQQLITEFDFTHLLDNLTILSIEQLKQAEKQALAALAQYKNTERSNTAQKHCYAECHALIEQTRTVKKVLDKSYRQLEKLYKFADKQLKGKDDKLWKDSNLRNFKVIGDLLDDFHEAINPAMPLEFKTIEQSAVYWLHQIDWLQERFPNAIYEDVTGLCKLASLEEIKEQDYSLNPGRYVGVVIEEDGMTEEEFGEEVLMLHQRLQGLDTKSLGLQQLINLNLSSFLEN